MMNRRKTLYIGQQKELKESKEPKEPKEPKRRHVGHPRKFSSAKKLQKKVDSYFELVAATINTHPTIYGLILHCGFCDRASFYSLEKLPEFSETIKKARSRIAQVYENALMSKNAAGSIFALKNFGWSDKLDMNLGGQPDNPVKQESTIDISRLPTALLESILRTQDDNRQENNASE